MEAYGRVVAREEASKGIRVNNISPGVVITPIFNKVPMKSSPTIFLFAIFVVYMQLFFLLNAGFPGAWV